MNDSTDHFGSGSGGHRLAKHKKWIDDPCLNAPLGQGRQTRW